MPDPDPDGLPARIWHTIYHEFGIRSVQHGGRDVYLVILSRSLRLFAYGANSLILALFFSELGFSDFRIGLFMSMTLLGDVVLTIVLTVVADKVGRRKTILFGAVLMVISGTTFVVFENFWLLLIAAVVGVISASGGDFGPFRAIEESMLSQVTTSKARNDVLAWYVTSASLGSAIGTEASGRIVDGLRSISGWSTLGAYHAIFSLYVIMGLLNIVAVTMMSDRMESEAFQQKRGKMIRTQDEAEEMLMGEVDAMIRNEEEGAGRGNDTPPERHVNNGDSSSSGQNGTTSPITKSPHPSDVDPNMGTSEPAKRFLSQVSGQTRSVMFKLWPLLAVDSIADGMVSLSLTTYYLEQKFHPATSTLGDINSISYFLAAASTIFAGPLANHLGLLNTMVFTHVPSSAAVLLFPMPHSLWMTIVLFFIRTGLNNMDQAPRSAFIAAAVKPTERTAVLGITATLRTLSATAGPSITGLLAGSDRFWLAFVVAGSFRLAYDFGLWALFVNMKIEGTS